VKTRTIYAAIEVPEGFTVHDGVLVQDFQGNRSINFRILDNPPAVSVPDGWKLIPIEPTQAMMNAAFDAFEVWLPRPYANGTEARNAIYAAMLAASPEAHK